MSIALTEPEKPSVAAKQADAVHQERDYLAKPAGALSWVFTLDHKRIAALYLAVMVGCLLFGCLLGMLLQIERWNSAGNLLNAQAYHRTFTNHGLVMVFLVILPGIPAVIGNFLVPILLGSKGLAFPRLSLTGFYLYGLAALLCIIAMIRGGADTGWDFQPGLTVSSTTSVSITLLAVMLAAVSCLLNSLNFIADVHRMRATGMSWYRIPLLLWSLYASSWVQLLAIPVLCLALLLLLGERVLEMGFFQRDLGGETKVYQHLIGFFSHAAITVVLLPALGVICEVLSVHSRRPIVGYRLVAWSLIAVAICGLLGWGQQLSLSGQSGLISTIFSLLSFLVAVPLVAIVVSWLATLQRGSLAWNTPMLYAIMFILVLAIGGLSGLFLSSLATRVLLHDTSFAVAHLHYLWGSVMFGFVAGLHHWWPKMTGRSYHDGFGVLNAWLLLAGFNLAFFPQFIAGSQGLPRRLAVYPEPFQIYQQLSTCGACLMALSLLATVAYLLHSLFYGERAPANPWGGGDSLEWQCGSPPAWDNS